MNVSEEYMNRVIKKPEGIESFGTKTIEARKIVNVVKNIAKDKAIRLTEQELTDKVGKCWSSTLSQAAKAMNFKIKIHKDKGDIIIFQK